MTPITDQDNAKTIRRKLAAQAGEDYDNLNEDGKSYWTKEMLTYMYLEFNYLLTKYHSEMVKGNEDGNS